MKAFHEKELMLEMGRKNTGSSWQEQLPRLWFKADGTICRKLA